jgi:eukaryotic-like serine/threonine-protein kinase
MSEAQTRRLGKYELIERLGQGGMAEVYKAFQPGVERIVATKLLHSHRLSSADFVARFRREARAIGRLQHPNIVRVLDFGAEDDVDYLVMDYVAGGTLSDYLRTHPQLPLPDALAIVAQLADALAYAHQQGLIHRDIKPDNIMFTTYTQVILTDFGLARLLDDSENQLTLSGAMIGTPTYMSPEAVQGETCDARSDLYSLGVVLYEMVTGRPPYTAKTPYSMMLKQANEPLPLPRTVNPDLPPAVEQLLLHVLTKDPAERLASAAAFAQALQQVRAELQGDTAPRPTVASPTNSSSSPLPGTRSPWVSFLLATNSVLLIALLTIYVLIQL